MLIPTKAAIAATAVAAAVGVSAAPAGASFLGDRVSYGHLGAASACSSYGGGACTIRFTDNGEMPELPGSGRVNCAGVNAADLKDAITQHRLDGRYVAVLWHGSDAVGSISCH